MPQCNSPQKSRLVGIKRGDANQIPTGNNTRAAIDATNERRFTGVHIGPPQSVNTPLRADCSRPLSGADCSLARPSAGKWSSNYELKIAERGQRWTMTIIVELLPS